MLYFVPVYYAKNQPYFNVQKLFDFVIDREIDPEISYYDYGIEKMCLKSYRISTAILLAKENGVYM